jgi:hypothetical protein
MCGRFDTDAAQIWNLPCYDGPRLVSVTFSEDGMSYTALSENGEAQTWQSTTNESAEQILGEGVTTEPDQGTGVQSNCSYTINSDRELLEHSGEQYAVVCRIPLRFVPIGVKIASHERHVVVWHECGSILYLDLTRSVVLRGGGSCSIM